MKEGNNRKDAVGMASELNTYGYSMMGVGQLYPGALPGMGCQLSIGTTLNIAVRMENPSDKEVTAFRSIQGYGFYQGKDLPHGLLLWHFGNERDVETPFNPRLEETVRPQDMQRFLNGKKNACQRVLLDENGIVKAIALLGLDWKLVELLRKTWSDPNLDWAEYDSRYASLATRRSTSDLWRRARKWAVANVTASQESSDSHSCPACQAAEAKTADLKEALKQAQAAEAEHLTLIAHLRQEKSALEHANADLKAKLESVSTESLQREVTHLKTVIEERCLEIEIQKEDAENSNKDAAVLRSRINDLERHNEYLAGLLRKSEVRFNTVYGHADKDKGKAA